VRLFWSEAESPELRAIRGPEGAVAPRFDRSGAAGESRSGVTALGRPPGLNRSSDGHSDRLRPESPVVTGDLPASVLAVPGPSRRAAPSSSRAAGASRRRLRTNPVTPGHYRRAAGSAQVAETGARPTACRKGAMPILCTAVEPWSALGRPRCRLAPARDCALFSCDCVAQRAAGLRTLSSPRRKLE
jgi:hypothetical protein